MSQPAEEPGTAPARYGRRAALRAAAVSAAGVAVAGCGPQHLLRRAAAQPPVSNASAHGRPSPRSDTAPPRSLPATLPPEVRNGPRNRPGIALTFHGQGTPAMVRDLLIALEDHAARGTFLAVGSWLDTETAFDERIRNGGPRLGHTTMLHTADGSIDRTG